VTQLAELGLRDCRELTDLLLAHVAAHCSNLVSLYLRKKSRLITVRGLQSVLDSCDKLAFLEATLLMAQRLRLPRPIIVVHPDIKV